MLSLTSYNSVNVAGVANNNPAIIAASSKEVNNPVNCRLFIYAPGPCAQMSPVMHDQYLLSVQAKLQEFFQDYKTIYGIVSRLERKGIFS
jgi:hypothetical protein